MDVGDGGGQGEHCVRPHHLTGKHGVDVFRAVASARVSGTLPFIIVRTCLLDSSYCTVFKKTVTRHHVPNCFRTKLDCKISLFTVAYFHSTRSDFIFF